MIIESLKNDYGVYTFKKKNSMLLRFYSVIMSTYVYKFNELHDIFNCALVLIIESTDSLTWGKHEKETENINLGNSI